LTASDLPGEGEKCGRGSLVLVATPIGNLGDLSTRAREALQGSDVLACEDTRRTARLLNHEGIAALGRLVSLNEHNEARRIPELVDRLDSGQTVAVVSDAGMPLVSDPGARLVDAAVRAGARVSVVPGPSAALAALVVSGLDVSRFTFYGFLARKGRGRREVIAAIAQRPETAIVFESPYRVVSTLMELSEACGEERRAVLARELTKVHEEVVRGTLGSLVEELEGRQASGRELRGEVVVVVSGSRSGD